MERKPVGRGATTRERVLAHRERRILTRERSADDHELANSSREDTVRTREDALRMSAELDDARVERERLVAQLEHVNEQLKEANEHLLLTTVHADEMAERARASERAKDEFLAMLGHELRNPLSPILMAVDCMDLRDPTSCPDERAIVRRQARHMARLVDDLLDIARITGGKLDLQREHIELSAIVTRAIEMVSPLLEAKTHQLRVRVSPADLVIDVDPTRLAQVAANLIANAAKYTPNGGEIVVSGFRRGANVVLSVKDNGIGISAEMLPRVFDMFSQEQQALDRAQGGLGLGLAIVSSLVSMHGGTVTAHSEGEGKGSEFVVELPAFVAPAATPEDADQHPTVHADLRPLRILIVDDNRDTADLTAQALSSLGHDVRVAYDPQSALAAVTNFLPDAALLDIGLPAMDGYELARHLRAHVGDVVRFVAISGYGQTSDRQRSRDAGFAEHLVKPISFASLQAALQNVECRQRK
jgi:signal transduction histidine kinase/ActR/RegA family two-component response regulator